MYNVHELIAVFWSPKFWLPPGITWKDAEPQHANDYSDYRHLYLYPIPFTACLLLFRFALEKYCFRRLGVIVGLNKKAPTNPVLEKAYTPSCRWTRRDITALAKQTDYSERQIERWHRLRKMQDNLYTFTECCWACFYHSSVSIYGLTILWTKPWFWNLDLCWTNYIQHGLSSDMWWYYMMSLSFISSLFVSQIFDSKRKDYWQMCIHHIITAMLLSFSWVIKSQRIGCDLLIINDVSDAFLYGSKACYYAKCDTLLKFVFVTFIIVWYTTKLIYYPFWILHSTLFRSVVVSGLMSPVYYLLNGLLIGIFVMDLYWSYSIYNLIMKIITHGKMEPVVDDEETKMASEST